MTASQREKQHADVISLHVPFRLVRRGGRKGVHLPDGAAITGRSDSTLVKALARAFRWKRLLESGEFVSAADLAAREGIAPSYLSRILRLTLLAPDIIEVTLDGSQPPEVSLEGLLDLVSEVWGEHLHEPL